MNKKEIQKVLQNSSLESLIANNLTLYAIRKELLKSITSCPSSNAIENYILKTYHKTWDKESKEWILTGEKSTLIAAKNENTTSESTMEYTEINAPLDSAINLNEKNNNHSFPSNTLGNPDKNIDMLIDKISNLELQLSELDHKLKALSSPTHNSFDNSNLSIEEITKIYASEKQKKSISINVELKNKFDDYVLKTYNVKNNDSLIVNIALLLALKNAD